MPQKRSIFYEVKDLAVVRFIEEIQQKSSRIAEDHCRYPDYGFASVFCIVGIRETVRNHQLTFFELELEVRPNVHQPQSVFSDDVALKSSGYVCVFARVSGGLNNGILYFKDLIRVVQTDKESIDVGLPLDEVEDHKVPVGTHIFLILAEVSKKVFVVKFVGVIVYSKTAAAHNRLAN